MVFCICLCIDGYRLQNGRGLLRKFGGEDLWGKKVGGSGDGGRTGKLVMVGGAV